MIIYYWAPPLLLVGGLVGFYLQSYLKVKAESLATREDLKHLLKQTAALTQTTKDIEAKVSGDLWDRQKRWEMKREVLFEAVKRLNQLEAALENLAMAFYASNPEGISKCAKAWDESLMEFDGAADLAKLLSRDVGAILIKTGLAIKETARDVNRRLPSAYDASNSDRVKNRDEFIDAVRKELGV